MIELDPAAPRGASIACGLDFRVGSRGDGPCASVGRLPRAAGRGRGEAPRRADGAGYSLRDIDAAPGSDRDQEFHAGTRPITLADPNGKAIQELPG